MGAIEDHLRYEPETGSLWWTRSGHGRDLSNPITRIDTQGYRIVQFELKTYLVHRVAHKLMTGQWPTNQIDHDNRTKHDNRWLNINGVTDQQNKHNMPLRKDNKTGVPGVSWHKGKSTYQIHIGSGEDFESGGYSKDFFEAICVRKRLENKYSYHPNHGT